MKGGAEQMLFKYILIGDTEVGKSSIMLQFTEQNFLTNHDMTIGVEFDSRSIDLGGGVTAKLEIWDTAGQESYLSITRSYYRGTDGCFLVFDITRRESFDHLPRWLNEAKQNSANPNLVLMLIGNKADLEGQRQVSKAEAQAFADSNNMLYAEFSAKNAGDVEQAFRESARRVSDVVRKNPRKPSSSVKLNDQASRSDDCSCG